MATYAEKIYANERDMIEGMKGRWRDEGGVLSGIWHDVVVNRMSVVDAKSVRREFLLTERAASEIGADCARFYGRGSEPGFVSINQGRDPRPTLEAHAGAAEGAAIHEFRERGPAAAKGAAERVEALLGGVPASGSGAPAPVGLASLMSEGAPYVVIPASKRGRWKQLTDDELRGRDEAFYVARRGVCALVLGTPDTVYAFVRPDGARIVRVVSFDAADDGVLAQHVAAIDGKGFARLAEPLDTDGPLVVLSAVVDGKDADTLMVEVGAGSYLVSHGTVTPDDGTELLVVDLVAVQPAKAAKSSKPLSPKPSKKPSAKPAAAKRSRATK